MRDREGAKRLPISRSSSGAETKAEGTKSESLRVRNSQSIGANFTFNTKALNFEVAVHI